MSDTHAATVSVRLDKWLWAARFFKTRAQAKQAIEGGKVHYNGARSKVSKLVEVGALLKIRQGWDEKTVEVRVLSDQRRGAPEAALLYRETPQSLQVREEGAARRRAERAGAMVDSGRPTKRDRRRIHDFKERAGE